MKFPTVICPTFSYTNVSFPRSRSWHDTETRIVFPLWSWRRKMAGKWVESKVVQESEEFRYFRTLLVHDRIARILFASYLIQYGLDTMLFLSTNTHNFGQCGLGINAPSRSIPSDCISRYRPAYVARSSMHRCPQECPCQRYRRESTGNTLAKSSPRIDIGRRSTRFLVVERIIGFRSTVFPASQNDIMSAIRLDLLDLCLRNTRSCLCKVALKNPIV